MAKTSKRYAQVTIDGEQIQRGRLAWFYTKGAWPERWLDHINGDASDDRIANLREATPLQNKGNTKKPVTNTSGFKGVSYCKIKKKWRAMIKIEYRSKPLGYFESPEDAHQAYMKAAIKAWGEFARAA
jgi:hypothetical protein